MCVSIWVVLYIIIVVPYDLWLWINLHILIRFPFLVTVIYNGEADFPL